MKSGFLVIAAAVFGLSVAPASAQYYAPPGYGYGPPPLGGRCDAFLRTPYGPRRVVCPLYRPRPLDAGCECPPPDPYAPPAHGRVIP